ncbi:MAG: 16S rRNA (cytosine(1402)-N(4))-methyltransferase RsmH [Bacteroidales bacterium]|jgi:16S rRNA (cytosine1402-N4)-methyltransferase|nr:16S rRNA (cytosine(1402)-N(4))-methyltransferase RsmH [Bacteroidales bacterium]
MYHKPVLLNKSIEGLNINPDGIYFDVTFGGGGHSKEILKNLSNKGHLYAIDRDPDAHKNTIDDKRFTLIYGNFRYIKNYIEFYKLDGIDGILADFGVSSHQFDISDRGFSFRLGGELDMRMNPEQTTKASDILNQYSDEDLYRIFKTYCDIHNPGKLVKSIVEYRQQNTFEDIEGFIELLKPIMPYNREIKYKAQIFQALRIEVNDEINSLNEFLDTISAVLHKGGRLSAISYHSLEDRPVKNLIKTGNTKGNLEKDIFGQTDLPFKAINRKIIIPNEQEINENPRAKSAKLRIAEKI